MTINYQKRLKLASRIAEFFADNKDNRLVDFEDCGWMVGMVCDITMSDAQLLKEIEDTKRHFPGYSSVLNWKNAVYCVFGYPDAGDYSDNYILLKIFAQKSDAEKYMAEENKKSGWERIVCISEEEVN